MDPAAEPPMPPSPSERGSHRPISWASRDLRHLPEPVARARGGVAQEPVGDRSRRARPGRDRLADCLLYPLRDGPGVALLVFLPPVLWFLSIPVFDIVEVVKKGPAREAQGFVDLSVLVIPFTMPMLFGFAMIFGYALLFLGHVLVASALGEDDHPGWPEWDSAQVREGVARWFWAGVVGLVVGGFPAVVYWRDCGDIDLFDKVIFGDLVIVGVGYAQVALMASLLHDRLAAANPLLVVRTIGQIGWDYLRPCLLTCFALALAGAAAGLILFRSPSLKLAALGLWAFWVFILYEAMVLMRVLGLTYHRRAAALGWFRERPRWAASRRTGRIYANS